MDQISNNQIKLLRKLKAKKNRLSEGLFLVEGKRAVEQILTNGIVGVECIFTSTSFNHKSVNFSNIVSVEESLFIELANTESPQGIIAICTIPKETEVSSFYEEEGILVATDGIQDPGNLGTIFRSAVWYGTKGILLGTGTTDLFNPKVVRSTAGATGILNYLSGDLPSILTELEKNGWQTLLLDGNPGATPIQEISKYKKIVLVVGNEANGISDDVMHPIRQRIIIPTSSNQKYVESLNAGVALSIALAHVNN